MFKQQQQQVVKKKKKKTSRSEQKRPWQWQRHRFYSVHISHLLIHQRRRRASCFSCFLFNTIFTFTLCRLLSVQICCLCQCNVTLPSLIQFVFITEDVRKTYGRQLPRHQNMFTAPSLGWWWSFVSAQTLFKGESSSITCMRVFFFCYFIITIFFNVCIIGGRARSNRPSAFEHLLFRNAHNNWRVVEQWRPQVNEVYHGPLKPLALQSAATSRFQRSARFNSFCRPIVDRRQTQTTRKGTQENDDADCCCYWRRRCMHTLRHSIGIFIPRTTPR